MQFRRAKSAMHECVVSLRCHGTRRLLCRRLDFQSSFLVPARMMNDSRSFAGRILTRRRKAGVKKGSPRFVALSLPPFSPVRFLLSLYFFPFVRIPSPPRPSLRRPLSFIGQEITFSPDRPPSWKLLAEAAAD